ncbi:MAG: hypothetical protein CL777_00845 [Chloroflexi bacterium]|nr:hypothetical protein [Chloroflexota bacterium]|tara:strand:- start:8692 stop:9549 length:858 start_codon:yes stop_codon:yes gene_type:complete
MHNLVESYKSADTPLVICDYSPPRSPRQLNVESIEKLPVDYFSVAYNPGRSPRVDSITVARSLQEKTGKPAIFTIATRDMNKIAIQSQLLGAYMAGLSHVLLLGGDSLSQEELALGATEVRNYKPTELIASTAELSAGWDYRGKPIQPPPTFCIGAALDTTRDLTKEVLLAEKKIEAGANFFISQPIYEIPEYQNFLTAYRKITGKELSVPVFWGLQMLTSDGPIFGNPPKVFLRNLEEGISSEVIAKKQFAEMKTAGIKGVYLIPPISANGRRSYSSITLLLDN